MSAASETEVIEPRVEHERKGRKWVEVVYDQRGRRVGAECGYHEAVVTQQVCLLNDYLQVEVEVEDHDDDCWCFPAGEEVAP